MSFHTNRIGECKSDATITQDQQYRLILKIRTVQTKLTKLCGSCAGSDTLQKKIISIEQDIEIIARYLNPKIMPVRKNLIRGQLLNDNNWILTPETLRRKIRNEAQ